MLAQAYRHTSDLLIIKGPSDIIEGETYAFLTIRAFCTNFSSPSSLIEVIPDLFVQCEAKYFINQCVFLLKNGQSGV